MDNGKAKQALFSLFYRNWHIEKFNDFGISFISTIDHCVRQDVYRTLKKHVMNGHKVIIVSASIENRILPWAEKEGIEAVIATRKLSCVSRWATEIPHIYISTRGKLG